MQHLTVKATVDAIDSELGQFSAIASSWSPDREKDTIARNAFDATIAAWRTSGKRLPLLHEHTATIVGSIDLHRMRAEERGLVVAGKVDRESGDGRAVWRAIKAGVAGFSIGGMFESRPRKGGGREIHSIDLLEISFTSRPMHGATKVLTWKSATEAKRDADAITAKATRERQPLVIETFEC